MWQYLNRWQVFGRQYCSNFLHSWFNSSPVSLFDFPAKQCKCQFVFCPNFFPSIIFKIMFLLLWLWYRTVVAYLTSLAYLCQFALCNLFGSNPWSIYSTWKFSALSRSDFCHWSIRDPYEAWCTQLGRTSRCTKHFCLRPCVIKQYSCVERFSFFYLCQATITFMCKGG